MKEKWTVRAALFDSTGHPVATGENRVRRDQDPSAHAEVVALRYAWAHNIPLRGLSIRTTLEPCVMCAGILRDVGIRQITYEQADPTSGACGTTMNLTPKVHVAGPRLPRSSWQGAPEMRAWVKAHHKDLIWTRADWFFWSVGSRTKRHSQAHRDLVKVVTRVVERWASLKMIPNRDQWVSLGWVKYPPNKEQWEMEAWRMLKWTKEWPMAANWAIRALGFAQGKHRLKWHREVMRQISL